MAEEKASSQAGLSGAGSESAESRPSVSQSSLQSSKSDSSGPEEGSGQQPSKTKAQPSQRRKGGKGRPKDRTAFYIEWLWECLRQYRVGKIGSPCLQQCNSIGIRISYLVMRAGNV